MGLEFKFSLLTTTSQTLHVKGAERSHVTLTEVRDMAQIGTGKVAQPGSPSRASPRGMSDI